MKTTSTPFIRSATFRLALVALGGAMLFAVSPRPAAVANTTTTSPSLAEKAVALPVTVTFAKIESGENKGRFDVKVKNVSKKSLSVSASVLVSVQVHSEPKIRNLPAKVIEPGAVWTIEALAALDQVTLTAEGFEPLVVVVR